MLCHVCKAGGSGTDTLQGVTCEFVPFYVSLYYFKPSVSLTSVLFSISVLILIFYFVKYIVYR